MKKNLLAVSVMFVTGIGPGQLIGGLFPNNHSFMYSIIWVMSCLVFILPMRFYLEFGKDLMGDITIPSSGVGLICVFFSMIGCDIGRDVRRHIMKAHTDDFLGPWFLIGLIIIGCVLLVFYLLHMLRTEIRRLSVV